MIVETKELYGTELHGSVDLINNEREHQRVGLIWDFVGGFLTIREQPRSGANLAAHRVIADEVAKHVKAVGVNMTFNLPSGEVRYEIRPGEVTKVD